jgi:hypothetical protein
MAQHGLEALGGVHLQARGNPPSGQDRGRGRPGVTGAIGTVTSAPSAIALFGLEMALSDTDLLPLLSLDRAPGTRYQIEFLANLPSTNWNWLVSVTNLDTRFYYVGEPATNHSPRFYRAIQR